MYQCQDPFRPCYHGKWWSRSERARARRMYSRGFSLNHIANTLGRTVRSVRFQVQGA